MKAGPQLSVQTQGTFKSWSHRFIKATIFPKSRMYFGANQEVSCFLFQNLWEVAYRPHFPKSLCYSIPKLRCPSQQGSYFVSEHDMLSK